MQVRDQIAPARCPPPQITGCACAAPSCPNNPAWYHNLVANPDAEIEIGTQTFRVRARVAESDERAPIWEQQKRDYPGFADY